MLYLKYKFCLKNWRFNDSVFFISCPQFLFCNSNILLLNGYTVLYSNQQKALLSYHKHVLIGCEIIIQTKPPRYSIGTRFVDPPFFFLNSSLLWDIFIINSVEQLQTLPKTKSEIDISPFLKTQKPSSTPTLFRDRPFNLKGGGVMVFCFVQNFFSDNTRVIIFLFFLSHKAQIFFPEFNIRLYDKNSESDYFFSLHQNQNIFFSKIGNQNIFLEKNHKLNGRSLSPNHF